MQDDVGQCPVVDVRSHVAAERLASAIRWRAWIDQAQPGFRRRIPGDVTMAEHQDLAVRIQPRHSGFAAGRGAGLVHHREMHAG
jgi:hypothetical protein